MKASLVLIMMITLVPTLHCHVKDAIINERVTLPCFCQSSQKATWSKFLNGKFVSIKLDEETSGTKQSGMAITGDASKGNYSLTFRSTVYNDSGFYRCSCDSQYDIKLQVLDPSVITASVGKNISLKCYGQDVKDLTWKKDGHVVWPYSPKKKENVSDGRLRVYPKGFTDGHFFLHISSVQLSDAGLYRCFFDQETIDGDPRAIILNVHNSTSNKESQPSANNHNAVCTTLIVLGFIYVIAFICFVCYRKFTLERRTL